MMHFFLSVYFFTSSSTRDNGSQDLGGAPLTGGIQTKEGWARTGGSKGCHAEGGRITKPNKKMHANKMVNGPETKARQCSLRANGGES